MTAKITYTVPVGRLLITVEYLPNHQPLPKTNDFWFGPDGARIHVVACTLYDGEDPVQLTWERTISWFAAEHLGGVNELRHCVNEELTVLHSFFD